MSLDIFQGAKLNSVDQIYFLLQSGTSPDERDDNGCTPLHICCTYGSCEAAALLLKWNADLTLQDYENGWTPLHRSIYFRHIKITLLLLKAGAVLTRPNLGPSQSIERRSLRNVNEWISPLDQEGNSPLDLLSKINSTRFSIPIENINQCCTELLTFGKADFILGIPLPHSSLTVSKPKPILDLEAEHVVDVIASKFHSAALTSDGRVYTWGIGKGGRLGHGNELNLPSPTIIQSFLGRVVITQIASSENHMLAIDKFGGLYSWGSNRYGQLGRPHESTAEKNSFSPLRVEKMKRCVVCGIAAGETHSVCSTTLGEVWTWGSNSHGQLGVRLFHTENKLGSQGTSTPVQVKLLRVDSSKHVPGGLNTRETPSDEVFWMEDDHHHPNEQIQNLSSNSSTHFVILQVCASRSCTVVIVKNIRTHVSEVYQWGYGSHSPTKLQFFRPIINNPSLRSDLGWSESQVPVNITQIAAGFNHFIGIDSSTGYVYTWGFGAVQLGHGTKETPSHLSTPLLLESMMPENGGGSAVFVSAAGDRSCIVTNTGDLFSWGFTDNMGALGHGQGIYQPTPRPVEGIKGAVKVACGVDHTIVLISAIKPTLPYLETHDPHLDLSSVDEEFSPLSLKQLCEISIAKSINLQNAISILNLSFYYSCPGLFSFALQFILRNLDIILIQLFNSTGSLKSGASIWSELDVIITEIEESIQSLELEKFLEDQQQPPHDSPAPRQRHLHLHPQAVDEIPNNISGCKKMLKNLRKQLTSVSEQDRGVVLKKLSLLEKRISLEKTKQFKLTTPNEETPDAVTAMTMTAGANPSTQPLSLPQTIVESNTKRDTIETSTDPSRTIAPPTPLPLPQQQQGDKTTIRKNHKLKYVPLDQFEKDTKPIILPPPAPLELIPPSTKPSPAWHVGVKSTEMKVETSPFQVVSSTKGSSRRDSRSNSIDSTPSSSNGSKDGNRSRGNSLTLDSFIQFQTPKKTKELSTNPSPLPPTPTSQKGTPWKSAEKLSSTQISSPSSLHNIQKEEEIDRQRSSIKSLQGNTIPWLIDRKTAQISSLEDVIQSQMIERNQQLEQQELEEALAAVAKFEQEEEMKKLNQNKLLQRKKGSHQHHKTKLNQK